MKSPGQGQSLKMWQLHQVQQHLIKNNSDRERRNALLCALGIQCVWLHLRCCLWSGLEAPGCQSSAWAPLLAFLWPSRNHRQGWGRSNRRSRSRNHTRRLDVWARKMSLHQWQQLVSFPQVQCKKGQIQKQKHLDSWYLNLFPLTFLSPKFESNAYERLLNIKSGFMT